MQVVGAVMSALRALTYPYYRECADGIRGRKFPVFVSYPVQPTQRWGFGHPPHPRLYQLFDAHRGAIAAQLEAFRALQPELLRIPDRADPDGIEPFWTNRFFPPLDGIALYALLAQRNPRLYVEIGSGNSTKFAARAIRDHRLDTRIVSIDPSPRAEIDRLADEVIRTGLESVDLSLFERLGPNDIVFFDGSHRCFMNSDVTVFFLEVMPATPVGALIHIHDIYLPNDYPPTRTMHYESEQYLLAALLLSGTTHYDVVMPNNFVEQDAALSSMLDLFWAAKPALPRWGSSFWMRRVG